MRRAGKAHCETLTLINSKLWDAAASLVAAAAAYSSFTSFGPACCQSVAWRGDLPCSTREKQLRLIISYASAMCLCVYAVVRLCCSYRVYVAHINCDFIISGNSKPGRSPCLSLYKLLTTCQFWKTAFSGEIRLGWRNSIPFAIKTRKHE